jgi:4'-phosphopantetheinyl transferase
LRWDSFRRFLPWRGRPRSEASRRRGTIAANRPPDWQNRRMRWLAHGEHELPAGTQWLSPREREVLAGIRYTKRYTEFLTRRFTAKRALAALLQRDPCPAALAAIEIGNHPGGAPLVALDGRPAPIEVSLSDRAGWAVCLVGPPGSALGPLGVDLEIVEPRSDAFIDDFFTASERDFVRALPAGGARDEAANLIWSAKEAALKVLKVGLRADTREVEVEIDRSRRADGWAALRVTARDGAAFPGWWRRDGVFLLTVAGSQPGDPPVPLDGGGDLASAEPTHSWLGRPLV